MRRLLAAPARVTTADRTGRVHDDLGSPEVWLSDEHETPATLEISDGDKFSLKLIDLDPETITERPECFEAVTLPSRLSITVRPLYIYVERVSSDIHGCA